MITGTGFRFLAAMAAFLAALVMLWPAPGDSGRRSPAPRPETGRPAPDFNLQQLDGTPLSLSALHGQPVVLNFWASWCLPCRKETALLQQVYAEHRHRGLAVVGVNLQESRGAVAAFGRQFGVTYPLLLDPRALAADRYGVVALPTTLFIDAQGILRGRIEGELTAATIAKPLAGILPEKAR